ncbi:MAG TPA: glycosyltransferase family 2 protein [Planctomycetaceae bacterium]|nr:glycosyltransferase family 2 protein [Planctomycetaceae bacterium]
MTASTLLELVFWACTAGVVATYALYPLTLRVLGLYPRPHAIGTNTPPVTLVISAFNESAVIREKVENALALDYPRERLEIMVVSDASDDGTDEIVASFREAGVVLCRQDERRGKSAGLTRFVPAARGEIVVFSDANSMYEPDAVRRLVEHFADPRVGFVAGHQRYVDDGTETCEAESLYWRYETWLKIQESRIGSVVCGDGAIYAIRAGLFEPLRDDDINDFTLPLRIVVRGYRGLFDPRAGCYERTADDFAGEFRRKMRIVNRSFGAVLRVPQALNPFRVGLFAYELLVHKVVRWFVPFLLAAALAASVWLAAERAASGRGVGLYAAAVGVQAALYGTALLGFVPGLRRLRPVYIAFYFCLVNAAAGLGIVQLLAGWRTTTWDPERRVPGSVPAATRG